MTSCEVYRTQDSSPHFPEVSHWDLETKKHKISQWQLHPSHCSVPRSSNCLTSSSSLHLTPTSNSSAGPASPLSLDSVWPLPSTFPATTLVYAPTSEPLPSLQTLSAAPSLACHNLVSTSSQGEPLRTGHVSPSFKILQWLPFHSEWKSRSPQWPGSPYIILQPRSVWPYLGHRSHPQQLDVHWPPNLSPFFPPSSGFSHHFSCLEKWVTHLS